MTSILEFLVARNYFYSGVLAMDSCLILFDEAKDKRMNYVSKNKERCRAS